MRTSVLTRQSRTESVASTATALIARAAAAHESATRLAGVIDAES
jgi:hypothetical protein